MGSALHWGILTLRIVVSKCSMRSRTQTSVQCWGLEDTLTIKHHFCSLMHPLFAWCSPILVVGFLGGGSVPTVGVVKRRNCPNRSAVAQAGVQDTPEQRGPLQCVIFSLERNITHQEVDVTLFLLIRLDGLTATKSPVEMSLVRRFLVSVTPPPPFPRAMPLSEQQYVRFPHFWNHGIGWFLFLVALEYHVCSVGWGWGWHF